MKVQHTPWLKIAQRSSVLLFAASVLAIASTAHAQTLLLDLKARNYNNTTGVWTDSGSANTATGPVGLLTANSTPNGSSTVGFNGTQSFTLATALPAGNSYTAFAFIKFAGSTTAPAALFGGNSNSFEYRIYPGKQDVLRQGIADLAGSNTVLSTTAFSSINVATTSTTSPATTTFRLNGVADGSVNDGGQFSNTIQYIGSNAGSGGGENFNGQIAEIVIYSGVLTNTQIAAVEAQFTASYVNAVPEPGTWTMALAGLGLLFGVQRLRARKA